MDEPVDTSPGTAGPASVPPAPAALAAGPLSDDALETSKLLVELIHVVQASRASTTVGGRPHGAAAPGDPHPGGSSAVSPQAIRASIHLYQHGPRTIGELAQGLGVSLGWASRVVSELEAAGLVTRSGDPADRRVVHVSLAPSAIAVVEEAYRWRGDAIERALNGLDAEGRAAVQAFLRRAIEELGPQADPKAG